MHFLIALVCLWIFIHLLSTYPTFKYIVIVTSIIVTVLVVTDMNRSYKRVQEIKRKSVLHDQKVEQARRLDQEYLECIKKTKETDYTDYGNKSMDELWCEVNLSFKVEEAK